MSEDGGETYDGPFPIATTNDRAVPFMRAPAIPSAEVDAQRADLRRLAGLPVPRRMLEQRHRHEHVEERPELVCGRPACRSTRAASTVDHFTPGIGVDPTRSGRRARLALTYSYFPTDDCTLQTCRLFQGFVSSVDGGGHWSEPLSLAGPMRLEWLPDAGGRFVGDYVSTSFVGRRAIPVFARATRTTCTLGQVGSCNEDMVAPKRGLPVRGGSIPMDHEDPFPDCEIGPPAPAYPRAF